MFKKKKKICLYHFLYSSCGLFFIPLFLVKRKNKDNLNSFKIFLTNIHSKCHILTPFYFKVNSIIPEIGLIHLRGLIFKRRTALNENGNKTDNTLMYILVYKMFWKLHAQGTLH